MLRCSLLILTLAMIGAGCTPEPHYIRLEKGFNAEVEVFRLRYKRGEDSASSAKLALRYFDVDVFVSDDSAYTVWQEKISDVPVDSSLSDIEFIMQAPSFVNGVRAVYSIREDGFLGELLNWPEIKAYADSISMIYIAEYAPDPMDSMKVQMLIDNYNTREVLENNMFKCINVFHVPYGLSLDTTDGGGRREVSPQMGIDFADEQLLSFQKDEGRIAFLCAYPEVSTAVGQNFLQSFAQVGVSDSIINYAANVAFTDTIYGEFNPEKNRLDYAHFHRSMRMRDDTYVEIIEVRVIR